MKIKYTGKASVRRIEKYSWSSENGFVQDVMEVELAANLLTYPRNEFEAVGEVSKAVMNCIEGKITPALVEESQL